MVYILQDDKNRGQLLLVKANSEAQVRERLSFRPDERVIGSLSDVDINGLAAAPFATVSVSVEF